MFLVLRGLCNSPAFIKHNCKINSVNLTSASFLWNPWCFDIPVALKPTFLNMNVNLDQIHLSDLVQGDQWDHQSLNFLFGNLFENSDIDLIAIDLDADNYWIWAPKSSCPKISPAIYHFLNTQNLPPDRWAGWHLLQHIPVTPRLKLFIWICLRGRLSTFAFLHSIHLSPDNPCIFCGLHRETIDHLLGECARTEDVWDQINTRENLSFSFPDGFSSGNWIIKYRHSMHTLAIITAGDWFIWICWCNAIFKNLRPNYSVIVNKAAAHVHEFSISTMNPLGKKLILNNFSSADGYFLFINATSNHTTLVKSVGFFFSNANYVISLTGCISQPMNGNSSDEIMVLEVALQTVIYFHIPVNHIFSAHHTILEFLCSSDHITAWWFLLRSII